MSPAHPSRPWYAEGIRFACQSTGRCCTNHGEFAWVYVSPAELRRLAALLRLTPETIKKRYTERLDGRRVLRSVGGACIFLRDGRCSVYRARPVQCATWPFWKENLDEKVWKRDVEPFCPGVGRGRLFEAREIEELAEQAERALDEA